MAMTYEEAKAHLEALRLKQTRYTEEVKARGAYVREVLGYERASDDALFAMLKCLEEGNAREIEAFKPVVNAYPEAQPEDAPHKTMWSNLSEPEKCALALLQLELGKERFMEICKQGYETAKRRTALAKKKKLEEQALKANPLAKDKPTEHDVFERMMRDNRNTFASERL